MITHGGRLSVQEAVWNGVPMLGLIRNTENQRHMSAAQLAECADVIRFQSENSAELAQRIRTQLQQTESSANARRFQERVYESQPNKSLNYAIESIIYVLQHGNARHLQLLNGHLYFHQTYMLDVCLVVALLLLAFVLVIVRNCGCCCRRRRRRHDESVADDLVSDADCKEKTQ